MNVFNKGCFCLVKDNSPAENQECAVIRSNTRITKYIIHSQGKWTPKWITETNRLAASIDTLPDDMWIDQEEFVRQFTPPPLQLKKGLLKAIMSAVDDALTSAQSEMEDEIENLLKDECVAEDE